MNLPQEQGSRSSSASSDEDIQMKIYQGNA